jgi:hypothetical protein
MRVELGRQAQPPVDQALLFVLNVREVTADGPYPNVVLLSGTKFRARASDIHDDRLTFLRTSLHQYIVENMRTGYTRRDSGGGYGAASTIGESGSGIRMKCATDWPDDFRMREYCEKQQRDALRALQGRSMNATRDHETIRRKCAADWSDDFKMRDYCERQQLDALSRIR